MGGSGSGGGGGGGGGDGGADDGVLTAVVMMVIAVMVITYVQRLEVQLEKCKANRDRFKETLKRVSLSSQEIFEKRAHQ